ncbi:ABC transporter substrate-binding protein [Haloglomus salinum]|jgi:peptide/nickel transport system substrate-binding protein|uniref:ABC transporter substrate-binding protein n=1 Tax=Haloglomus salinum TaxID=2962673 RepID=UPI0020C9F807|nr:ABC transporter substrate-binding protein [Haloglomus salinum]
MDSTHPQSKSGSESTVSRRRVLGALGGGTLAASAGCVRQVGALMNREAPEQLSFTIKTAPADADPRAIRIARFLAKRLQAVGIEASITPMSNEVLLRDVLLNHAFDIFIAPMRGRPDPDFLRPLLHSRFGAEPGTQNPYGYANLDVDALLERQRAQTGKRRRKTLARLQRSVVRDQPFSVVAFPDEIRVTRADGYAGWEQRPIHTPLGYLGLDRDAAGTADRLSGDTSEDERALRMTLTDSRPTESLNPLAPEFRASGTITDLLYDPLGRWVDGQVRPWLASSWTWSRPPDAPGPVATVELREDLTWHDGTDLTASDVAFTYRLLADTSLGRLESPVPAPRFRGLGSLVTDAEAVDERTVRLSLVPSSRPVATRSLTAPVLPEHVWEAKAQQATVAGLDPNGAVTQALVWSNPDPVGSGPLRLERRRPRELLVFARNEDHFLTRDGLADHLAPFAGGFTPDQLAFTVVPSGGAAVELVRAGDADATASGVMPADVPEVGRSDELNLHVTRPRTCYQVGYNVRRGALSSPRFRRAVGRLLDKQFLAREVFERYGQPAASPLARHRSVAPSLVWNGEDPELPFPGEAGQLDVERAREAFRDAGYRYSSDGDLLGT